MEKEKLYRIKPELRGYFGEKYRDIKRTQDFWRGFVDPSALEEVKDSPKITGIGWSSSYLGASVTAGCTLSFVVIFDGDMYVYWTAEQREAVGKAITQILSAALIGKTWEELAKRGEKESETTKTV